MEYKKQFEFLKNKFESSKLAHAYVFAGQDKVNLMQFTKEFVMLLEKNVEGAKNLIEQERFVDMLVVASAESESSLKNEKDMMEIDVDQIRQVNHFLSYKSYYDSFKSVIIQDAERMNLEAQSCLLKTLEEPKGKTIIILLSANPEILMSTIFSRCQVIKFFSKGDYQESLREEKILQELLRLIDSDFAEKFQYVKKADLQESSAKEIVEILQRYFRKVMLAKLGLPNDGLVIGETFKNYSVQKLQHIMKLIEKIYYQLSTANASPKLALEILLMEI